MDKLDVLMFILGVVAYIAIMGDLRNYERKLNQYEQLQKKKKLYVERITSQRARVSMRNKDIETKVQQDKERDDIITAANRLS